MRGKELTQVDKEANLAEIKSRTPSGIYRIRPRQLDDHNPFWQAGWEISQDAIDHWNGSIEASRWAMIDTGTNHPVIVSTEERIRDDFYVWVCDLVNDYLEAGFLLTPEDYDLVDASITKGRLHKTLISLFEQFFVPGKMPKLYNPYRVEEPIDEAPIYETKRYNHKRKRGKIK